LHRRIPFLGFSVDHPELLFVSTAKSWRQIQPPPGRLLRQHRTSAENVSRILAYGFVDGIRTYMTDREFGGVWLSDRPLDPNDGAWGDTLLSADLELPGAGLDDFEWVEAGKGNREFSCRSAQFRNEDRGDVEPLNRDR
jgi:hypothetical protein